MVNGDVNTADMWQKRVTKCTVHPQLFLLGVWTYSISKNESVQSPVHELSIFIQFYFTVLIHRMMVGIYNFVNKLDGW